MTNVVDCPLGQQVLGGGGMTDNSNAVMVASRPQFLGPFSWSTTFKNLATSDQTVEVTSFAVCANVNP